MHYIAIYNPYHDPVNRLPKKKPPTLRFILINKKKNPRKFSSVYKTVYLFSKTMKTVGDKI